MFSLYIHIPFCVRKCLYCDFLSGPCTEEMKEAYVRALLSEIRREAPFYADRTVETIFFGGGTPSLLSEEQLTGLMDCVRQNFHIAGTAEISMEMNPGTATAEKIACMRQNGINRLSIGLQSASDECLKRLGRIHTFRQFEECFRQARESGFSNINVDVMAALPGQSLQDYEQTLHTVLSFEPEHISAYSLIVEEGTWFYENRETLNLPDEDTDRRMYERTAELLAEQGYRRYEISNYAREGFACRHNLAYWKRTDYAGFGIGAASFVNGVRFCNTGSLERYLAMPCRKEQVEPLSREDAMEEFMFLGLRCMEGVSVQEFQRQFGVSVEQIYGRSIRKMEDEGLLKRSIPALADEDEMLFLSKKGIDVSNYVFEHFLL